MLRTYAIVMMTAVLLSAAPALAEPRCKASASVKHFDYPGTRAIISSNNLLVPTGKAIPVDAQKLILSGRVVDSHCRPIAEAMVELWQTGPLGKWRIAPADELASPYPVFAGAGRTYTNMDGYYSFITAFPAPLRYSTPNINIRVKPERMPSYSSALFFADDVRNDSDKTFQSFSTETRNDVLIEMHEGDYGDLIGTRDIVMPGEAPYRTY